MSASQHGYHFASEAQWKACLRSGADLSRQPEGPTSLRPLAAFAPQMAPEFETNGAAAPAYTRVGELLWRDGAGRLHRLPKGYQAPYEVVAPEAIARAQRLVATSDSLWLADSATDTVQCFDLDGLSRRWVVEEPGARVIDIAAGRRDGILVLVAHGERWFVVRIDCAGTIGARAPLEGIPEPKAFTYLRADDRIVVLSGDGKHLFAFTGEGGAPALQIPSATLAPCFVGCQIASDPRGRVFVAGSDDADASKSYVVVLDAFGVKLDPMRSYEYDVALREPATGLAASRDELVVTGARGLYRFPAADPVPDSVAEVGTLLVTPMLEAPDTEDGRRWLRVEATASLPPGAWLEIAYASTSDVDVRHAMRAIERDASIPEARRAQLLRAAAGPWSTPIRFQGSDALGDEAGAPFAIPLHDVRETHLWVAVSLAAGAGAKLPALSRLSVLHPGRTLMEHLPAIYQREEAQSGSLIRALVGVLETTTQDLDAGIAQLGRHIHPKHAPAPWLDYLARWLGLPWDDALSEKQKRCIVQCAARIAQSRGTRAGLELLLQCLMPEHPRRFRVTDVTADFGFAMVGDAAACRGSALPAVLGGSTRPNAQLGSRAVLGAMRLPCPGQGGDDASELAGRIRVDLAASAAERNAWEPWLRGLIAEMVPLTARAELRWVTASALRGDRLDDELRLEGAPTPHLGTDAVVGLARLPEGDTGLSAHGPTSGTRLH